MKYALLILVLAGCSSMPQDPYAANHEAPRQVRLPSSNNACETLRDSAPNCQIGDSYNGECRPMASQEASAKLTKYECRRADVPCTEADGKASSVETVDYVTAGEASCK